MAQIGLAVGAIMLCLLLTHFRQRRLAYSRRLRRAARENITLEAMTDMVTELAPTLRETAMVTAPQSLPDRGHVWASPCGKRVYIN